MPKHNQTGRSKARGPFVRLDGYMLESEAWQSLAPAARAILIEVRRRYRGNNNGRLPYSVREAASDCRINKDTAARALADLQDKGFLECATPGGFTRKIRHATEWRLSDERCDATGALPSKAFMRWRPAPPEAAQKCRSRSQKRDTSVPSFRTVEPLRVVK